MIPVAAAVLGGLFLGGVILDEHDKAKKRAEEASQTVEKRNVSGNYVYNKAREKGRKVKEVKS